MKFNFRKNVLSENLKRFRRNVKDNSEMALIKACLKLKLQVKETSLLPVPCQQLFHRNQGSFIHSG